MTPHQGPAAHVVVNHVVLPHGDDPGVLPLYAHADAGSGGPAPFAITGRRGARLRPRERMSFGTYFNAFPCGYWERWTSVQEVRLSIAVAGSAEVDVMRSDESGVVAVAQRLRVDDGEVHIDIPLAGGGFAWFELGAGAEAVELVAASWSVSGASRRGAGRTSIGMTTFNRPAACLAQLQALAGDELDCVLDRIVLVDQGSDEVSAQPGFAVVAAALGDQLSVVRQPNLGGSGGFARTMLETVDRDESDYLIVLDDDAITEPQSVFRAVRFSDFADRPVLVGGAMLNLHHRTELYAQGEKWVDRRSWMRPASPAGYRHDFAVDAFPTTAALHRTVESDFNGWWFCLIPRAVLRRIGLAMPLFLKFDDAEFALRARAAGSPTVSLPGVGVWHEDWTDKDPTRTWEGYFILRNQIITGLLHSTVIAGGLLPVWILLGDAKLLLMQQYSAVRLRHEAVRDALRGPDALSGELATTQARVRRLREGYPDAEVLTARPGALPRPSASSRVAPTGARAALLAVREGMRHLFVRPRATSRVAPEATLAAQDVQWWRFAGLDSALVALPASGGSSFARRNRLLARRMILHSVALALSLALRWPFAAARYRRRVWQVVAPGAWRALFLRASG